MLMTLFATPLAFYGYHITWIRQRHSAIESGEVDVFGPRISAPFPLTLYGEAGYDTIYASAPAEEQVGEFKRRLTSLFSEAEIYIDVACRPKSISDGGEVLP